MGGLSGLNGLAGIQAIETESQATPEQRMGGPADPFHGQWGEQARPYAWESSLGMGGSHGPYGPENQMLGDDVWFIEAGGMAHEDPAYDYNTPDLSHSHGSVKNVSLSGPIPSAYDSINHQITQIGNHGSDLNGSARRQTVRDEPLNDQWQEIWDVEQGTELYPALPGRVSASAGGFGTHDRASNAYRKNNEFGYGEGHHHRRFATGSIPGNYMWMRPGGRMMNKTLPGPARPPIGEGSPFQGDDLGEAFAYDNGAVLQATPSEYVPPPSPHIQPVVPAYDDPMGTEGVDLW